MLVPPLLLAVAVMAPFMFAGAPRWAWGALAGMLGVAVLAQGIADLTARRRRPPAAASVRYAFACVLIVLVYAGIQSLPLATGAYWAHAIWAEADIALESGVSAAISIHPQETRASLVKLLMVVAACGLAFQSAGSAVTRDRFLAVIAATAGIAAVYALVALAQGWDSVLWVRKPAYHGAATGPFINPNAFAAYLGLGILAASAILAARTARDGVAALIGPAWTWSACWIVVAAALVATQSRAGQASTMLALIAFFLAGARRRQGVGAAMAMCGLVITGSAIVIAFTGVWHDLPEQAARRLAVYAAVLEAVADRPWLGHGLGSFADVFAIYRPSSIETVFLHAHNGYLQAALELGIPGATLITASVALVAVACWRNAGTGDPGGRVGVAAAVLLATHALVDFAPQVPAVAITAAILLGVGARLPQRLTDSPALRADHCRRWRRGGA